MNNKLTMLQDISASLSPRPLYSIDFKEGLFINREEEIKRIVLAISTRDNVLLVGDRGSGKTSILNYVEKLEDDKRKTVAIPISLGSYLDKPLNSVEFLAQLISSTSIVLEKLYPQRKISETLRNEAVSEMGFRGFFGPRPPIAQLQAQREPDLVMETLKQIVALLREKGYYIAYLIDDADKIEASSLKNSLAGIRDYLWKLDVSIVMTADEQQLSTLLWPPLDQFFRVIVKLNPLSRDDLVSFIAKRLKSINHEKVIPQEIFSKAAQISRGNPRLFMTVIKQTLESAILKGKESVSPDDMPISATTLEAESLQDEYKKIVEFLVENKNVDANNTDLQKRLNISRPRLSTILNDMAEKKLLAKVRSNRRVYFELSKGDR